MITKITKALQWLWKWQKNSRNKSWGEQDTRYLGVKEKGMIDDVRDFLQEIRMQDKLPDILRQRNISVEEFKRLEELHQLYQKSHGGDAEAQRILTERFGNDPDRSLEFDGMMNEYDEVKDEMTNEGEFFVRDPRDRYMEHHELDIPDLPDEPTYPPDSPDIMSPEHRAEYEQISDIQRRWSELAMEDVPQTDERTQALERVRTMMGNARRISGNMDRVSRELGPSQARQMFDATQWISRTNEELDSIRSGDYRSWADRTHPSHESIPIRERNIRNRINRENSMTQEEIDSVFRGRRRRGLPPYFGEGGDWEESPDEE